MARSALTYMPAKAGTPILVLLVVVCLAMTADRTIAQSKGLGRAPAAKASEKAFRSAKKEFQSRVHNKKPSERISALRLLADFPIGDAADLVYVTLLDDHADEVRQAAIDFLRGWRDRNDVADKLLARMTTSTRKEGLDIRALGALQALAGTEDATLQNRLIAYLDEFLGTPLADLQLVHGTIDELAPKGDAEVLRLLMLLMRAHFFDVHFGFRRCLVQGLTQNKEKDSVTHLIKLLPKVKGLVQFDVISYLVQTTGQNFRDDADLWLAWWVKNQNQSQPPKKSKPPPIEMYGKVGQYYGIPICAKRVVFVLDTSGSMRGGKLEAAKSELIRAINEIPKEVAFSLVIFNSDVRIWQRELVAATDQMKRIAANVVIEQDARNDTASYDALEAAFGLDPEAIYFVSDGAPQGGKISDPGEIVGTISHVNRVRRISIHSIGIDTRAGTEVSPFARFMKSLADANWGIYHPVGP